MEKRRENCVTVTVFDTLVNERKSWGYTTKTWQNKMIRIRENGHYSLHYQ